MRAAAAVVAALAFAVPASAAELRSPKAREAFFGTVWADAPARATRAELYVGSRRVAWRAVTGRRVRFAVPWRPGRFDLRVRFERGSRLVRRDEARGAWLLPASAGTARRERGRDAPLARRLAALGRAYDGYAGLWVHDLRTGRTAGWNSDTSFPAASLVKLGVLVAALDRFGPRPERSRAWPLIRDVATWSSNHAANRLLVLLGGSQAGGSVVVNRTLRRLGATSSWFTGDYRLNTARDAPRPLPVLTFRRTTAHDVGRMLFELHAAAVGNGLAQRRTGLSRHEARVGLGLLLSAARGENVGVLRPAVPDATPIARKEGWTTKLRHSAGILYTARGPKLVVVLTFRPDEVRPAASLALGRAVVRTIAG